MISDVDIIKNIKNGKIIIEDGESSNKKKLFTISPDTGLERTKGSLDAHGINLRVNSYCRFGVSEDFELMKSGEVLIIEPDEFILIESYEKIKLNNEIAATIHSMARHVLVGMNHISTTIQPGFAFNEDSPKTLVFAIHNFSKVPIELRKKDYICRIVFS